ncbi:major type 1 subunit fimbrin (pilin) [Lysobacter sp. OAE881]|uniref:fimbrial protein n=1 Tax=Lysobacter sp. OAE881 TaxID=2663813 RepID=UPI001789DF6C
MKKTLLSTALVAVVAAAAVPSAFAADGKITFRGQIEDTTCTVSGGTGTDGGAQNFTVTLPTIQKTALSTAGSRAGDTPFSIVIGGSGQTGCTNGKVVKVKFEGAQSPIDAATGRLKNTVAAGNAAVVQVGLLNDSMADINLVDNTNAPTVTISSNTAKLNYWAQYYAPATGVTAGAVDTFAMYSVAYN